jgi:hypothetical protein
LASEAASVLHSNDAAWAMVMHIQPAIAGFSLPAAVGFAGCCQVVWLQAKLSGPSKGVPHH